MDFQPWEPPPPPPLDRNVSVMLSSLHTLPSRLALPPSPLTEKDGTHLPAGHPNVTYFALLAYNHAMSPTFPPIFLHPPWCIWPKWGLVSKGRKNPFSEIEKKSLTVAKLFQLFQHIDVTQSNVPACLHQRALTEEGQGLSESRKNKTLEGNSSREIVKQTMLGLTCSRCILY